MNYAKVNSVSKILLLYLKKHWFICLLLLVSITITGSITGTFMIEALRRVTQSILDKSTHELVLALTFLLVFAVLNFIFTVTYKSISFILLKNLTIICEDSVYQSYREYDCWDTSEEVLGQMRKNITETITNIVNAICTTYQSAIVIISGCIYAITLNYIVLLIALFTTGIMIFFSRRALKNLNTLYKDFGESRGKVYSSLWEQIKNREIAHFLIPDRVLSPYERECKSFTSVLLKAKKIVNRTELFSMFGSTIMIILVSVIGGTFVIRDQLTISSLLALIIVIPTISSNLFGVPSLIANWQSIKGQSVPITNLMKKENTGTNEIVLQDAIRNISVENLNFGYEKDTPILKGVSLDLTTGFYAISGSSGCGKSTFIKILCNLLPQQEGEIKINGNSLRKIDRYSFWNHISMSEQTPVILNETLLYNIIMEEEYDEERLKSAIQDAQLNEFVSNQPDGLNTVLNPETLSKGECQKVNMARIFYRKADLLFLDEVTAALDPKSEKSIMEALKKRVSDDKLIVLCISHRDIPLSMADKVIYFLNGRIKAIATHENLRKNDNDYQIMLKETGHDEST